MEPVQVLAVSKSSDGNQANYWATDAKASYTLLSPCAAAEDYNPASVEWVPGAKVVAPPPIGTTRSTMATSPRLARESFEKKPGFVKLHAGLPMSYLQIKTVEAGTEWYKANSKYPDEVCEMMAKYEWGDLSRTTKKEFKNIKKKTQRKKEKGPGLTIKRGPVVLPFD